jgi:hypothetical protein
MNATDDVTDSGTIDVGEMMTMLHNMEMEYDEETVLSLLKEVDEDGSGQIEFPEFVALVARIKRGDQALKGFAKLVDTLNNSPMNILEKQAVERQLDISYRCVEIREDTFTRTKYFVYECMLTGDWWVRIPRSPDNPA